MNFDARFRSLLAAATTLLVLTGTAKAAQVTQSGSPINHIVNFDLQGGHFERTISFAPFDPSLGTLTSAFYSWSGHQGSHGTLSVSFTSVLSEFPPYSGSGQGQATSTLSLNLNNHVLALDSLQIEPAFQDFQALSPATVTRAAVGDDTIGFGGSVELGAIVPSVPIDFNVVLDIHDVSCSGFTSQPDVSSECSLSGSALVKTNLSLTYVYTPVPLPASLGLLALGVGGLGVMRRR